MPLSVPNGAFFIAPKEGGFMKRTWYEIRDANNGVVEVLLYDEIGSWGISAKDFVKELGAIKANTINLRINSPGGDVFDGVAIYNGLKNHRAAVHAVIEGLAASSASFISQAGDTVLMATGSTMMIHEPNGMTIGDAAEHEKMAETLGKMGSWYRAQEAVDIKLADGLVQSQEARSPAGIFNLSKFKNVPEWVSQDKGDSISIENPYPNEHACRLRDPDDFKDGSFRRTSREHEGKSYDVISGKLEGETTMTEQAYRYPKDTWDTDEARSHCQDHDGRFEAASSDKETDLPDDSLADADWATAVGEYARYDAPEPNLEKMLETHQLEEEIKAGIASGDGGN